MADKTTVISSPDRDIDNMAIDDDIERYETPLPMLTSEVASLGAKVETQLDKMGFQL